MQKYTAPVSTLLSYGDARPLRRKMGHDWPDYIAELNLNESHIDTLITMATDKVLNRADSTSLEVWAPLHAWRALGQLRTARAVAPLLQLLDEADPDDHWIDEELPEVFALIGTPALAPICAYLDDHSKNESARTVLANALMLMAKRHPEHAEQCIDTIMNCLRDAEANSASMNGLLIAYLLDLYEAGIMDLSSRTALIEKAFQANAVDCSVVGDWEDVQIELGLLDKRQTPARNYLAESIFGDRAPEMQALLDDLDPAFRNTSNPNPVAKRKKIGRNDPCPCGSGKKYKKCCLLKARH